MMASQNMRIHTISISRGRLGRPVGCRAELAPTRLLHSDTEMFGSLLYVCERQIAFLIANVLYLIESRDGVANMRRIRHRLFARTREREGAFGQMVHLRSVKLAVFRRLRGSPGRPRAAFILDFCSIHRTAPFR